MKRLAEDNAAIAPGRSVGTGRAADLSETVRVVQDLEEHVPEVAAPKHERIRDKARGNVVDVAGQERDVRRRLQCERRLAAQDGNRPDVRAFLAAHKKGG